MKRPICESPYPEEQGNYITDLENYCDELEKELKFVKEVQTPDYERVQKELWEYQGAFEKSCVELSVGTGWFVNMPLEEIKEHFLK